ncbi:hypothetical protein CC99x_003910 [Candidatus Berkiella cookevillensis]|uniref:Uncharacterized protein n=1 Tax=Candidatus Berkiella cookevillensis TaxID=437022 RepID=A0A0Q9YJS4_9GAMM|nr:hypothetical protein [Candidatus Berkiella cookevillensis]MCS5708044.1 hypothetical protein [Candidatus Berkiella cookevillensis]
MSNQGPTITSPMDLLIAINTKLEESGKNVKDIIDGDRRRFFNETIKNLEGDKDKNSPTALQNVFKVGFLAHCPGASDLEDLLKDISGTLLPMTEENTQKIDAVFEKLDNGLKSDPKWNKFWEDVAKKNDISPEELSKIQDTIISSYRFKTLQYVSIKMMQEKTITASQSRDINNLLQAINGARLNKKLGDTDTPIFQATVDYLQKNYLLNFSSDINREISAAQKELAAGRSIEDIRKNITEAREKIFTERLPANKFAQLVGTEIARNLYDQLLPTDSILERIQDYHTKSKELGFDIDKHASLAKQFYDSLGGSAPKEEKDICSTYIEQLKSFSYFREERVSSDDDVLRKTALEDYETAKKEFLMLVSEKMFKLAQDGELDNFVKGLTLNIVPLDTTKEGKTLLDTLKETGKFPELQDLIAEKMFVAAENGDFEVLKSYLSQDIAQSTARKEGKTPLEIAKDSGKFTEAQIDTLIKASSKEVQAEYNLDMDQQNDILKTFAKDVGAGEYFPFAADLQTMEALDAAYKKDPSESNLNALKDITLKISQDYFPKSDGSIGFDSEAVVPLNLSGAGTPASLVKAGEAAIENTEKTTKENITPEKIQEMLKVFQDIRRDYSIYQRSGMDSDLCNDTAQKIIRSSYPLHEYLKTDLTKSSKEDMLQKKLLPILLDKCDLSQKNKEGFKALQLANSKDKIDALLNAGAKTTHYERSFGTRLGDTLKGLFSGKGFTQWNSPPERSVSEISNISGTVKHDAIIKESQSNLETYKTQERAKAQTVSPELLDKFSKITEPSISQLESSGPQDALGQHASSLTVSYSEGPKATVSEITVKEKDMEIEGPKPQEQEPEPEASRSASFSNR